MTANERTTLRISHPFLSQYVLDCEKNDLHILARRLWNDYTDTEIHIAGGDATFERLRAGKITRAEAVREAIAFSREYSLRPVTEGRLEHLLKIAIQPNVTHFDVRFTSPHRGTIRAVITVWPSGKTYCGGEVYENYESHERALCLALNECLPLLRILYLWTEDLLASGRSPILNECYMSRKCDRPCLEAYPFPHYECGYGWQPLIDRLLSGNYTACRNGDRYDFTADVSILIYAIREIEPVPERWEYFTRPKSYPYAIRNDA